jgi:hypothetical protein
MLLLKSKNQTQKTLLNESPTLDRILFFLLLFHLQTEAARPVLGEYYREPKKSGPLPFHLIGSLVRSLKQDHYVSDDGDVVYYQTDPNISGSSKLK